MFDQRKYTSHIEFSTITVKYKRMTVEEFYNSLLIKGKFLIQNKQTHYIHYPVLKNKVLTTISNRKQTSSLTFYFTSFSVANFKG